MSRATSLSYAQLAILAGVWIAVENALHSLNTHTFVLLRNDPRPDSLDKLVVPLAYISVSYPAAILVTYALAYEPGRSGSTPRKRVWFLPSDTQGWGLVLGVLSAAQAVPLYYALSRYSSSAVYPFLGLSLIYLLLWDVAKKTVEWRAILIPSALVIIGTVIGAIERWDFASFIQSFNLELIVVVGLAQQLLFAARSVVLDVCNQRIKLHVGTAAKTGTTAHELKLLEKDLDNALIASRGFWSSVTIILVTIIFAVHWDYASALLATWLGSGLWFTLAACGVLVIALCFFYIGQTFWNQALRGGGPVSAVAVLASIQVALGLPLTLPSLVCRNCMGELPNDWRIWALRVVAGVVVGAGVLLVARVPRTGDAAATAVEAEASGLEPSASESPLR